VNANSSVPQNLTAFNGLLYFSANDGIHGRELWQSNGTAAGTTLVADINPGGGGSNPGSLTVVGNELFFEANDGVHGTELWETNGTTAGTIMVKDINPGSATRYGATLIGLGGSLLFTADDGAHGMELWRSDGTTAGTVMVKDINIGNAGSLSTTTPTFAVAGGRLFFAADDGTHGRELWESDGTEAGTRLVMDINPGLSAAFPDSGQVITSVNGSLFFSADDGSHGAEPWVIPASQLRAPMVRGRGGMVGNPGVISPHQSAGAVQSLITSSIITHPDGHFFGTIAQSPANPHNSTSVVRASARIAGSSGTLGSSRLAFVPRSTPKQLFSDGPLGSVSLDLTFLDRTPHSG
jgi:ELWxxDGT repeat protein